MSTFVIHDGILYADTKYIVPIVPFTADYASKIRVSDDGEYVYALSGPRVTELTKKRLEILIRVLLEHLHVESKDIIYISEVIDGGIDSVFGNQPWSLCVSTKDRSYVSLNTNPDKDGIMVWCGNKFMPIGAGAILLAGLFASGLPIDKAYEKLFQYDPVSGGKVEKFPIKKLKPFVITGAVKQWQDAAKMLADRKEQKESRP